jgi:hypothetical protein
MYVYTETLDWEHISTNLFTFVEEIACLCAGPAATKKYINFRVTSIVTSEKWNNYYGSDLRLWEPGRPFMNTEYTLS